QTVTGKQMLQFVTESRQAARLQSHQGHAGKDQRLKRIKNLPQQTLGAVQHAKIVERAPATKVLLRDVHLESSGLQNLNCRLRCGGEEVIVEGICPKNYRLALQRGRSPTLEPLLKC